MVHETIPERPIPDAGDAVWNGHIRQIDAVEKRFLPDAGDAIANRHARQGTTKREGFHQRRQQQHQCDD